MNDKIKTIKKYLEYFPNDHIAKENLLLSEYANELGFEMTGEYYPRIEYGYCKINNQIKVGKKYHLTNSTTNYKQNEKDTIIIWSESCGRLAFTEQKYWYDVNDEWKSFMEALKSYNPIDYDEINNNYIYDLENGKRLINDYDSILRKFGDEISTKIKEIELRNKKEKYEKLKKELEEIENLGFIRIT